MIVTVTLNAAIDRTLTVPNFQLGQRHRASQGLTLAELEIRDSQRAVDRSVERDGHDHENQPPMWWNVRDT